MKKQFVSLAFCLCITSLLAAQQTLFEVLPDEVSKKILKGFIQKKQLTEDPDFAWYGETIKYFKPQAEAVKTIEQRPTYFRLFYF